MNGLTFVHETLSEAANVGVITQDEAEALGRAFVPHGDVVEVRRDWLADDELEALDRVCEWHGRGMVGE